ncbi:MAG: LPS export ABC transporter ATP-binding protein [Gammaproteobacteria bacterium]|nr:LPS export ABC transporter ATP-binding protein [Gammaproteobacteria bacterium]
MSRLWAKGLCKKYKQRQVVENVDISVESGQIVGLLGPNGAGKTTSFYMLAGLVSTDSGSIGLDEIDLTSKAMHQRAMHGVGYLPQEASVFRGLSVEKNILAILELRKDLTKEDRYDHCERLLIELQIEAIRHSKGISLSGGERRRVEIARALAMEPKFILLDEPFAGVDPISVVDIQRLLKQLTNRGIGLLITDHNVRETLSICSSAYILNQGKIIAQGSTAELLANQKVRAVYLGNDFSL